MLNRLLLSKWAFSIIASYFCYLPSVYCQKVDDIGTPPPSLDWYSTETAFMYDVFSNLQGGKKTGTVGMGDVSYIANVDFEKLGVIEGGSLLFYYLGNFGTYFSQNYVGDYQVVSNIEVFSTTKLYECWYQQTFFDETISIAIGIHDYNRDFDELRLSLHTIHSSFTLGPDISQVPPSNFPTTTLGARVRVNPFENIYMLYGVYDGRPAKPNEAGTRISLANDDGIFSGYEFGYQDNDPERYKKFSVGGWTNTKEYEDYRARIRNFNSGIYFLMEGMISHEDVDPSQGVGLFNAVGFAQGDRNQTDFYIGGGLTYIGPFPGRDSDLFTVGLNMARNSNGYSEVNNLEDNEKALEVVYQINYSEHLKISPDFQYIMNPGMHPDLDNAVVVGLRVELIL